MSMSGMSGSGVTGSGTTPLRLVGSDCAPGRLLGRAEELGRVAELLQTHRFVTIVGPGGMGKTTLARALMAQCGELYPDGVRFIDLAVLAEGRELAGALGAALGIARLNLEGPAQLAACLRGQRILIVFDCCEHHTRIAAHACEALLRAVPGIDVLCTSREALLAHSERIVRLSPMSLPGAAEASDPAAAARSAAVALFVARADRDNPAGLTLDADNVALVCGICRAVEGVPLALELAAALVRPLGLRALAQQTSRWLLGPPAGTALPGERRRTVSGMLDWSYDALSPDEQRVLRCLAVFRGNFTLEAAGAVASAPSGDPDSAIDTVIELAGKSLVSLRGEGGSCRARLLDLTREYAMDKLAANGELHAVQQGHARWMAILMDRLERDWLALPRTEWIDAYGPWVDDVLAAIDWALGPGKAPLLGARLAGVGFSLGDQIGVAREFQECVRRAVDAIDQPNDPPLQVISILLRLNAVNADGRDLSAHSYRRLMDAAERNLRLARKAGSTVLQGTPLTAMWGWPYVRGDYPASLLGAEQIRRAAGASADPYLELIGQRTMAQSLHFSGRHAEARQCATLALAGSHRRIPLAYQPSPVQIGTSMRIVLARVLWMEGAADQAVTMGREALASAEGDRPVALCQALCVAAIPIALWRGELAHARGMLVRLRELAEGHGLGFWLDWAVRFADALEVIDGAVAMQDRPSFADTQEFSAKCRDHLVTFSPVLLTADAVSRCAAGLVGWCMPELLRAQARARLSQDGEDRDGGAVTLLRRSLALAQDQGALGWALRSATDLAGLYLEQGAAVQGRATLEPVLARCREGQGTADLRLALALRARLG